MRIQFKTRVNNGGGVEPAGKIYDVDDEKAKAYIARGLAVEVKASGTEKATGTEKAPAKTTKAAKTAKAEADSQPPILPPSEPQPPEPQTT